MVFKFYGVFVVVPVPVFPVLLPMLALVPVPVSVFVPPVVFDPVPFVMVSFIVPVSVFEPGLDISVSVDVPSAELYSVPSELVVESVLPLHPKANPASKASNAILIFVFFMIFNLKFDTCKIRFARNLLDYSIKRYYYRISTYLNV